MVGFETGAANEYKPRFEQIHSHISLSFFSSLLLQLLDNHNLQGLYEQVANIISVPSGICSIEQS